MANKRSVNISGHATSISLEEEFWQVLNALAQEQGLSINQLVSQIDEERENDNLSSALRLYVLKALQRKLSNA